MLGIGFFNLLVLIVYLVAVTLLGTLSMRKIKGMSDFIMPRRFGKWMMTMHAFGSGTHSDQAVSVASKTYTNGLSGIWYQWLYLFGTPFYWLIAPMMRRFRALTTADIFELRYNRSVAMLYSLISIGMMVTTIGLMLKGSGAVISGASGGSISPGIAIIAMTILFVAYGTAGGLGGAIVTDFVQGIMTIIFSFLLLPFVLNATGGLQGVRETIADPQVFSLVAPSEIGIFYIVAIAVNGLIGIVTQPHILSSCAAGKTEREGQFGFVVGSFTKRFCTVAWCLTGLAGIAYYTGQQINPDHLYGMLSREFFPQIMPGMLGLFIATLLASVMSSCDSFMISASALFTENIYKPFRPKMSDTHYLWAARIMSVLVVLLGVIYAYSLSDVIEGLEFLWKIGPMMGIAFWLGLFWRRATSAAAWTSTLSALMVWWITSQAFFANWLSQFDFAENVRLVVEGEAGPAVYLPWQMTLYLSIGFLVGIVTSLCTQRTPSEKLERYYALQRTPVLQEENNDAPPCTLPEGVATLPRKTLFPNSEFELSLPSKRSVIGFAAGWLCVASIVGSLYWVAAGS
ncbi:sodium:solute symporter family protein [Pelagicoccus sp. SDUM812005]|uniref:sodium:solute symporter family protein n=1 Tax=Pelagicoccus sp. SDUM812005 TaxID=3041257 RepID=UPI00280C6AFA|nr:sodium:solute symporter family protein [Pelagicoccus sp. SDUM812005]MDQ8183668.1 sodium:solute symporter family protein [Pelagicoccus sp. SDUM812005]